MTPSSTSHHHLICYKRNLFTFFTVSLSMRQYKFHEGRNLGFLALPVVTVTKTVSGSTLFVEGRKGGREKSRNMMHIYIQNMMLVRS